MGVDTKLTLPGNVRVQDVAKVMGVLAGLKPEQYSIAGSKGVFVRVDGATVGTTHSAYMAEIELSAPDGHTLIDGERSHSVLYFFEDEGGRRLLMPKSTPFWIAVCRGLADFFGGMVDYNDCDDRSVNYRVKFKSNTENQPRTDEPWDEFHLRILNLTPLTKDDLVEMSEFASYQVGLG